MEAPSEILLQTAIITCVALIVSVALLQASTYRTTHQHYMACIAAWRLEDAILRAARESILSEAVSKTVILMEYPLTIYVETGRITVQGEAYQHTFTIPTQVGDIKIEIERGAAGPGVVTIYAHYLKNQKKVVIEIGGIAPTP